MGELAKGYNTDLNRLADLRAAGTILESVDEQRLRDHQLRRLRRLWLKDQCLTAREPLLPPKKLNWFQRLAQKEEAFWSRKLKFRQIIQYMYHGKDFQQIPLVFLYQVQRNMRTYAGYFVLPMLPFLYYFKYGNPDVPGCVISGAPRVFPGEESIRVRQGDVKFNYKTGTWTMAESEDEWKTLLK
ncbi:unnamed protein product [Clavelina lepadiformis]|uniref:NADH dehydrogenase [ubiquinone] 1 beta subcomplex subunit 6 n=1 Tax=Clavelina lepadiformis TaxID=159417 RepID=A0ABP0GA31_CLALP